MHEVGLGRSRRGTRERSMEYDIVFEGGGAKGIAFLGAFAELEARGHRPARIVGTSAGAIFSTLIAVGYDAESATRAVARRDEHGTLLLTRLLDPPAQLDPELVRHSQLARMFDAIDLPLLSESTERRMAETIMNGLAHVPHFCQLLLFLERGGLYEGEEFVRWLRGLIEERAPGLGDATFAQMFAHTGRDLSLVASDLDDRRLLVLNHRTAPRVPVVMAARMSMGIPLVWQEKQWDASWGPYMGRELTGHAIVDGGLLSNFPMYLIATDLAEVVEVMGPEDPRRVPNLGLMLDEEAADPDMPPSPKPSAAPNPVLSRFGRLVKTVVEARDRYVVERCMQDHEVCALPVAGVGTTEFDLSPERFDALVAAGRKATAAWFDRQA